MEKGGVDSEGREFKSAAEMWKEEVGEEGSKKVEWYRNGVGYWQDVDASIDGVLGGYGSVNAPDIQASEAFLNPLLSQLLLDPTHLVALDCGSGIGRVSKNLLIRYFHEVDLLEPVPHFLEAARQSLVPDGLIARDEHKATNFFCVPLQEFMPDPGRYDVIWIQWCIGHLTDDDFVTFFNNAKAGLKPGGFFILKENTARNGFVLDKEDCSVTRSDLYYKELFRRCGLHLYKEKVWAPPRLPKKCMMGEIEVEAFMLYALCATLCLDIRWYKTEGDENFVCKKDQKGFPKELFPVKMYALTTQVPKRRHSSRSDQYANRPSVIM